MVVSVVANLVLSPPWRPPSHGAPALHAGRPSRRACRVATPRSWLYPADPCRCTVLITPQLFQPQHPVPVFRAILDQQTDRCIHPLVLSTGMGFDAPLTLISLTYLTMHLVSLSIRTWLRYQGVEEGEGGGDASHLVQRLSRQQWAWKVFPVAAASGLEVRDRPRHDTAILVQRAKTTALSEKGLLVFPLA